MDSAAPDMDLSCPLWVEFTDTVTGLPYYYNVNTGERACCDPAPEAKANCSLRERECVGFSGSQPLHEPPGEGATRFPITLPAELASDHISKAATCCSRQEGGEAITSQAASEWWRRPARIQQTLSLMKSQYTEGNEHYNLWHGKYESDRFDPKDRDPAPWRCDPMNDSGWTQVDLPGAERSYFCIFFARGACNAGHRCNYYHRVPTRADADACDIAHDIFGRERFAGHRDDMDGVGSFNSDSQALFVADLRFDRKQCDTVQKVEQEIWDHFGEWGEIESVRVIPSKAIGFVRYTYRAAAEFAKVAMANQKMGLSSCISVRWAADDRNPRATKLRRMEREVMVDTAVDRRIASMGLSHTEISSLQLASRAGGFKGCTAPYPDTSSQYPKLESKQLLAPPTEEIDAEAEQVDVRSNIDRMNAVLARIDVMHVNEEVKSDF